jgi:uncharacterized protein DUF5681
VSRSQSSNRPATGNDYDVGYGRPPVATRFRLGGIGNPKGRPKKEKTVGQDLEEALMIRVRIEENGRSKTMTAQQVILRNLVRAAARGDTRAIHLVFTLRDRYRDSPETTLNPTDLESEDRKILEEYLAMLPTKSTDVASNSSLDKTNQNTDESKTTDGKLIAKPDDSDGDAS